MLAFFYVLCHILCLLPFTIISVICEYGLVSLIYLNYLWDQGSHLNDLWIYIITLYMWWWDPQYIYVEIIFKNINFIYIFNFVICTWVPKILIWEIISGNYPIGLHYCLDLHLRRISRITVWYKLHNNLIKNRCSLNVF